MKTLFNFIASCFAAAVLLSSLALATTPVTVTVRGGSGGVEGVDVTLSDLESDRSYSGRTDSTGRVSFPEVEPGRYRIRIEHRPRQGSGVYGFDYRTVGGDRRVECLCVRGGGRFRS